jgi:putative transposase
VILAHKIALDLTHKQAVSLAKAAGVARFSWNYGLAEWGKRYKAGDKPSGASIKKHFNRWVMDLLNRWIQSVVCDQVTK